MTQLKKPLSWTAEGGLHNCTRQIKEYQRTVINEELAELEAQSASPAQIEAKVLLKKKLENL